MLQFREDLAHRLSLPTGKSFPDPNNNGNCLKTMGSNVNMKSARGDKYSLRPRSLRRGCDEDSDAIQTTKPEPSAAKPSKSRSGKPKQKPAPLSKYRRKTANARERSRMREINAAFEALRRAVPHMAVTGAPCPGPAANTNEKLTKITTLRLAMRYISALSSVLQSSPSSSSSSSSSGTILTASSTGSGSEFGDLLSDCSDFDCLLSDGDSLTLSDHSLTLSDQPLTPVDFNESPTTIDTTIYFGDNPQLPLEFAEPSLSPFDPFLTHFS